MLICPRGHCHLYSYIPPMLDVLAYISVGLISNNGNDLLYLFRNWLKLSD